MSHLIIWYLFCCLLVVVSSLTNTETNVPTYKIEGNIFFPPGANVLHDTRILVNEGEFVGIPRIDGSFVIAGVPSGSYIVSINTPNYNFESVRVDIGKNGKIRARKVNLIDPREVVVMKYPLHFEAYSVTNYFEKREAFSLVDFIRNPMLLGFIAPIVLLILLPKLIPQDLNMDEAVQQANNMVQPRFDMPDLTDIFIRIFGGVRRQRQPDTNQPDTNQPDTNQPKTRRKK